MEFAKLPQTVAVPKDLKEMSDELDNLGGGDTRIAPIETFCRIQPLEGTSCIRAEGSIAVVR